MKVCGAMGRDQVLEHSTSTTGMFSRVHGGMMSCMERYFSSSFCLLILFDLSLCVADTFCDLTSTIVESPNSTGGICFAIFWLWYYNSFFLFVGSIAIIAIPSSTISITSPLLEKYPGNMPIAI